MVLNLYSGLKPSLFSGTWNPTGMPAVAYLLGLLNKKAIATDVYFIYRNYENSELKKRLEELPNINFRYIDIGKTYSKASSIKLILFRLCFSIRLMIKYKPTESIFYIDRDNVFLGSVLSLRYKVILRLHGVSRYFEKFSNLNFRITHLLKVMSFRAPFHAIICTEDGTPGKQFIETFCQQSIPKYILLNGIKPITGFEPTQSQIKRILFVGRLEPDKGCIEFANALISLDNKKVPFIATIIGEGSFKEIIKKTVTNRKNINYIERVPHSAIHQYYLNADIYVSLNALGNISNTVLEAISCGCCVITLNADQKSLRDVSTKSIFGNDFVYIDSKDITNSLENSLYFLITNPDEIQKRKTLITNYATSLITSWERRSEKEIQIITS